MLPLISFGAIEEMLKDNQKNKRLRKRIDKAQVSSPKVSKTIAKDRVYN